MSRHIGFWLTRRRLAGLGVVAIASATILGCAFTQYFKDPYFIYVLQVLSGNWPGLSSSLNDYFQVCFSILAVLLNTTTLAAVVAGAYQLVVIKRSNLMNIRNAFKVRDQIALSGIMLQLSALTENLSDEEKRQMRDRLWGCFDEANKKWETSFIPRVMPGASAAEFLSTIDTPR